MWSKAKVGMLLGAMATALSIGALGSVYAADSQTQPTAEQQITKQTFHKFAPGGWFKGFKGGKSYADNADLLALLKIDAAKLQEALKAGKSLADIAKEQGVAEEDVIALLTKQQEEKLAEEVKNGKLTQEQADKLKANSAERIKNMVENVHEGKGLGFIGFKDNADLLALLKIDAAKLQEALKAGKSLADIAKEQGVAEDDVIALLTKQQEEKLAEEVKNGKLTQEQADKLKANSAERIKNMVENVHEGKGLGFIGFKDNADLLALLKIDAAKLQEELKAGKSLADIAKEQGVAEDDVIALLTKQQEEKLAEAVKAGKLTQEQADKLKANSAERIKGFVENTHAGKGRGFIGFKDNADLLALLKIDAAKLQEELKAGKSLADIAKEQGIAEDDVIALLTKQQEEKLAEAVKAGKLTQEQADEKLAQFKEKVKQFVESQRTAHKESQ
ncbi:hypothetical protein [Brevibacillus sp. SYP-B805]|uniref:hypothetical protein n=1 Tax=Brevibacillus sp. SYP-B805 TaxID=1578199 RepID=UPI0019D12D72|nr:hypothetical protein [Brevibacillus sp. SYP-B805]